MLTVAQSIAATGGIAAGMVPVLHLGVIDAEVDALAVGCLGELLDDVALERRGINDVERVTGFEHRKAIVMLRGDNDVLHASIFGDLDEIVGIELRRVELVD